ncbi:MAG: HPr-rel-A system PqqD family peptide chaperone [Sulfuricella sp.]|jgi:PqqD family protein of HPr-rel-A system
MMWQAISGDALHIRFWNDEFVVYNSLSGDTHLLGASAAHILLKLQHTASDVATLAASLASLMQAEMDDEFLSQTEQLLAGLGKLALIEHS